MYFFIFDDGCYLEYCLFGIILHFYIIISYAQF